MKFSSVISIQIFSIKIANPSFYIKCVENAYFPLPSKFEMKVLSCQRSLKMEPTQYYATLFHASQNSPKVPHFLPCFSLTLLYLMHPHLVPKISIEKEQNFPFSLHFSDSSNIYLESKCVFSYME